jgi:XrtJ-associated TM-motif-TM protein
MNKSHRAGWWLLTANLLAFNAHAQLSGCVDSPENPAVVLGLIGLVAAGVPRLRKHIQARRQRPRH